MVPRSELDLPEPRDLRLDPISAPLVTSYSLKTVIDSPQFQQSILLPSGRTVSYATCGSRTGRPILYFYGLGGSSRQIACLHTQAVRLDIKLISVDRPGTGFTDPFKPLAKTRWQKKQKENIHATPGAEATIQKAVSQHGPADITSNGGNGNETFMNFEHEDKTKEQSHHQPEAQTPGSDKKMKPFSLRGSIDKARRKRYSSSPSPPSSISSSSLSSSSSFRRSINARVHHTCVEALAVVDHLLPGARFGLMGHSCGIYYIMHMVHLFGNANRIQQGPICLLTPWVPFNECPETTSRTFKFLKHVPRGIVWAVTSSMNHLGSVILSSSNALSGSLSNKNLHGGSVAETEVHERHKRPDGGMAGEGSDDLCGHSSRGGPNLLKKSSDPFIVQFSDAFDKVVLPALVQDMNRQHSNGYNSEIQMCVSDVGFDLASVPLPCGVSINAYCGHLDNIVPIEAAREMGKQCGWEIHEFKHSGHGGPRMSMYALEDYALALQTIELNKAAETLWSEKQPK
ncbi:hypothetical protein EDD11_009805 [Mortierella claussenii]|nr:hypothetical protein EDD11_009805 [Mortierella claussenii]